jgi:hypothetical protein
VTMRLLLQVRVTCTVVLSIVSPQPISTPPIFQLMIPMAISLASVLVKCLELMASPVNT